MNKFVFVLAGVLALFSAGLRGEAYGRFRGCYRNSAHRVCAGPTATSTCCGQQRSSCNADTTEKQPTIDGVPVTGKIPPPPPIES